MEFASECFLWSVPRSVMWSLHGVCLVVFSVEFVPECSVEFVGSLPRIVFLSVEFGLEFAVPARLSL